MASTDVVLSAALRNNLLSLQGTQRLIDTVQLRLATGLKVNSALTVPSSSSHRNPLSNRAGDLGRLLDGINLSIRTIEEADKGVTALTNLIEQAQSVASLHFAVQQTLAKLSALQQAAPSRPTTSSKSQFVRMTTLFAPAPTSPSQRVTIFMTLLLPSMVTQTLVPAQRTDRMSGHL
jgi:hypothetical protein